MKMTINANDFCPNDCEYYEQEKTIYTDADGELVWYNNSCKNKILCAFVYGLRKTENATKEED